MFLSVPGIPGSFFFWTFLGYILQPESRSLKPLPRNSWIVVVLGISRTTNLLKYPGPYIAPGILRLRLYSIILNHRASLDFSGARKILGISRMSTFLVYPGPITAPRNLRPGIFSITLNRKTSPVFPGSGTYPSISRRQGSRAHSSPS